MIKIDAMADTGLLVSAYSPDKNSAQAGSAIQHHISGAMAFTILHRLEFFNALRLRVFRHEITEEQMEKSIADWESDVTEDIFREVPLELEELFRRARLLSANHTKQLGARSLDLLHVAAALEMRVKIFYSFDDRQRKVAAAEKLTVRP